MSVRPMGAGRTQALLLGWCWSAQEVERRATNQPIARDAGTPAALDVRDDLFRAPVMSAGIAMESVRQVAAEHRALPEVHELADAVRPAEHASVGGDAHDDDVGDGALLEQIEKLLPVVG